MGVLASLFEDATELKIVIVGLIEVQARMHCSYFSVIFSLE